MTRTRRGAIASIAMNGDVTGTATMIDGRLETRAEAHGVTSAPGLVR